MFEETQVVTCRQLFPWAWPSTHMKYCLIAVFLLGRWVVVVTSKQDRRPAEIGREGVEEFLLGTFLLGKDYIKYDNDC